MIKSLWIAKTGLEANQGSLDVISNNLANTNTNGFKKSRAIFEDLLYQQTKAPGTTNDQNTISPTGLQIGTGSRLAATARDHSQGNLQSTGNAMDIAVQGNGFFQVQMPDGTMAYTRDGAFQVNADGLLVTSKGYPVMPQIQVPLGATNFQVGDNGTVTASMPGTTPTTTLGQINLTNFINPAGLTPLGGNLFGESVASGIPQTGTPGQDGLGRLAAGMLETSNVNVVEELVSMIQTQRAYEINSKAIQASDQMLQRIGQL